MDYAARAPQRAPLAHVLPLSPGWAWPCWRWWPGSLLVVSAGRQQPSAPHTALVEVRGEIAADTEASAENLVSALKRLRGRGRAGGGAAHQLARRQPGAGRHHQRRDPCLKALHNKKVTRWSRRCAPRRLLHRGGGRRDLRRQGQPGGQHRRADGRLQASPARWRSWASSAACSPPARTRACSIRSRRRTRSTRPMPGDDRPDPPAVHRGGQAGPRRPALKETPETFSACSGTASEAIKLGLADQTGNLDFVAREVVKGRGHHRLHAARERGRTPGQALSAPASSTGAVRAARTWRRCAFTSGSTALPSPSSPAPARPGAG